jgi:uncharacterized protein (TIGR02996 family)
MAQETELLRAIQLTPEDDALRLVYADWLEEYDQAERGELIRVQTNLARVKLTQAQRDKLRAREKALLDASAVKESLGPLVQCAQYHYGRGLYFDRGLPCLRLSPREFLTKQFQATAAAWFGRAGVQVVELFGKTKRLSAIYSSPVLANLHTLGLGDLDAKDEEIVALTRSPQLANLHALYIDQRRLSAAGVTALANSPHLTRLKQFSVGGDTRTLHALISSPLWPRLTGLTLGSLGADQLALLLRACSHNHLTRLYLSLDDPSDPLVAALAACSALRTLTALGLMAMRIGPEGASALAASPHLVGLRELYLDSSSIEWLAAPALANSSLPARLVRLSIFNCGFAGDNPGVDPDILEARFGGALFTEADGS